MAVGRAPELDAIGVPSGPPPELEPRPPDRIEAAEDRKPAAQGASLGEASRAPRRAFGIRDAAAVVVVALAAFAVYDSTRNVVVVDHFSVPESFEKSGLTGAVLANQLIDYLNRLRPDLNAEPPPNALYAHLPSTVLDALYRVPATTSPSLQPPDLEIPTTGLSLRALSRYISSVLGRDKFRISGELVALDDRLRLIVRVGDMAETFEESAKPPLQGIDRLLSRASRHVYRTLQPLVWLSWECQDTQRSCEVELRENRKRWREDQLILAHFVAGLIRTLQYRYEEAAAQFHIVMTAPAPTTANQQYLKEVRAHACVDRAIALKAQGHLQEALKAFDHATCQQHVNADSYRADTLLSLRRIDEAIAKAEGAVTATETALKGTPASTYLKYSAAYANYILGRALVERRRHDAAIVRFRRAAEHNEQYHWTFFWWARALQAQGKPEEAEKMLRKVGNLTESDSIPVRYLLATLLSERNRPEDAIRELTETVRINPAYPDPYYDLCVLYRRTGSHAQAFAHCHAYVAMARATPSPEAETKSRMQHCSEIIRELAAAQESRS